MTADKLLEQRSHGLFLAGDPGGASALLPVIKAWHQKKTILAYRQAVDLFQRADLVVERLDETNALSRDAEALLEKMQPGFVCAATSVNGVDWERHFFVASRKLGIPSVAVLDYWSNYTARFTVTHSLDALPDVISIMDERARTEMVANGFPAERLSITGQPVLDDVRRWHAGLSEDSRQRFRAQLGLAEDTRAFLFISQPLREMRRATGNDAGPSDDEFASLQKFAQAVAHEPETSKLLLIKMHPREAADKYQYLFPNFSCPVRVAEPQHHRWELCIAADAIFGMNSMLLEEALVMGCPVQRIQPDVPLNLNGSRGSRSARCAAALPLATDLIGELIISHLKSEFLSST